MSIMLYEHNRIAYENARTMLNKCGKAAIIHPTGTGKSFIGFKLCEDNPSKTILWLSPSQYIYKTQLENLKAESDAVCDNITFITYAKLMNMSEHEIEELGPDFIILDEFHRCGAAEWGTGVNTLIEMYKNVPILGLSATAIRYLDNQRDMADELFDGHIASEMTLGEAIVRGILNPPKYVLSIFSYKDELNRYERRALNAKNKAVRDKAEEYLEKLRRALDKAEGLDAVFDKHMTDRCGKYIVFCANYEAMKEAMDKTHEWFRLVDKKPHIYHVYSDDTTTSKEFMEFKNDEDDSHLRLLFCIDALNEGVHVENVSGVILLRPTVSPIIYKQQIGRALSASKKTEPVVFDIVSNIESLYSIDAVKEEMEATLQYMRRAGEDTDIVNDTFRVIDEVKNCVELFNALEDTLSAGWEVMYLEAKKYYEEHGNLVVPATYVTAEGYGLGRWIRTQRMMRAQGELFADEKIKRLDDIGMVWTSVHRSKWLTNYELAKKYFDENRNLIIPHSFEVTPEGSKEPVKLGIWISTQRENHAKGKLSKEQTEMLDRIGMCWDRFDEKWEMGFHCAKKYHEENGDINFVPKDLEVDGFNLNKWLHTQRNRKNSNKLSDTRIRRLEELGFKWSAHEAFWDKGYEYVASYKEEHGDLSMPANYECADGFKLKSWLTNQQNRYKKGNLTDMQIEKLMGIGCI